MSTEIKETLNNFKDDLLTALNLKKEDKPKEGVLEVKLGMVKSADGTITFEYEGETPTVEGTISVTAEDGTKVAVPVGEYALENGMVLIVTEEGVIGEVREAVEEAPAEMNEAPEAPAAPQTAAPNLEEIQSAIKSVMIKYAEDMEAKFDAKLKEVNDAVLELSKQPAAKPIKAKPEQKYKEESIVEFLNNRK